MGAADVLKKGDPCEVEFDRISYRYPNNEKDTLKELSFKIKAGEKIGLVGMNGAGKSTLIKLLCGLIRPTSGYIRINGVDITSMERTECYKLFSTVFQDLHIFPVSIKDNIVWDGQVDEACFAQCLEQADLDEWVSSLKEKENTKLVQELEEGAVNLSGGQSQKLLLARALYKNAPILLLDEPTVAESEVFKKCRKITGSTSAVYISHRLSACRFSDRILVFDDGHIIQEGHHDELVQQKGTVYDQLWQAQAQYYT
ncbi:ABC transporter ATP-binding protein [Anthropogastromicrobium aceti]|uniref:ABC transporter ATP-binding protein/permease n=1 Tax=Anthropogastromicrobium aceti TaxID=2981768 RepID=A0AAE3E596_9FIRM|nr:ABC transporter ATP-binding protein [Anthropogastromicrobium aceti]MCC2222136.1 ABC transporter ATP-binding protein/permease [Anthropogastromicrobium aceti]